MRIDRKPKRDRRKKRSSGSLFKKILWVFSIIILILAISEVAIRFSRSSTSFNMTEFSGKPINILFNYGIDKPLKLPNLVFKPSGKIKVNYTESGDIWISKENIVVGGNYSNSTKREGISTLNRLLSIKFPSNCHTINSPIETILYYPHKDDKHITMSVSQLNNIDSIFINIVPDRYIRIKYINDSDVKEYTCPYSNSFYNELIFYISKFAYMIDN